MTKRVKHPGSVNDLARKSSEMTYPNAYKKYNYGGKLKTANQKVTVKSTGTGQIYGARAVAQRILDNTEMNEQEKLLEGAIRILCNEDHTIYFPESKITKVVRLNENPNLLRYPAPARPDNSSNQPVQTAAPDELQSVINKTPRPTNHYLKTARGQLVEAKKSCQQLIRDQRTDPNNQMVELALEQMDDFLNLALQNIDKALMGSSNGKSSNGTSQ